MDFKDSLLYQLLKWIGAAVIGFALTIGCDMLLAKLFNYPILSYNLINASLVALGIMCMALSRIVDCPIRKFILASIGAIFTIKYSTLIIMSYMVQLPSEMILFVWPAMILLYATIAFLLFRNNNNQYPCLQALGLFMLIYILMVGIPAYISMILAQRMGYYDAYYIAQIAICLAVVYILSIFSHMPSMIRLAFICSGISILLLGIWALYAFFEAGSTITLAYGVFVLGVLSFIAYRLYHEKAEVV